MGVFLGVLGGIIIVVVLWDSFETIILPRRVTRRIRLTALFYRLTWRPWSALANLVRTNRRRETFLSYYGPLSTLFLLTVWAVAMILGFAMLHWALGSALSAPERRPNFATDLYMSGTTFFTLGLGDVTPRSPQERALTIIEAGLGFGFLAIVIGYLPVLYQAFSRREVNIALMDSRAGSPSSAVELLSRHRGNLSGLDSTLHELERWTAELLESHISYPVLSYFRSQHDNQSWLQAITTILDACALMLVGVKDAPEWQASLTFAIARHTVVDIAQILKRSPRKPDPDRLPDPVFARVRNALAAAGMPLTGGPEAQARLAALKSMYEPYANVLAQYLSMRLPPWISERAVTHNWETSAWGRTTAPGPPEAAGPVEDDH